MRLKMTVSVMLAQRTREWRQTELNQLAQRLRKARLDHDQRARSTREVQEKAMVDGRMEDEQMEKEWEERNLTRQQRVQRAHDRLHKALELEH